MIVYKIISSIDEINSFGGTSFIVDLCVTNVVMSYLGVFQVAESKIFRQSFFNFENSTLGDQ